MAESRSNEFRRTALQAQKMVLDVTGERYPTGNVNSKLRRINMLKRVLLTCQSDRETCLLNAS